MIRADAKEALRKWREVWISAVLGALGLYWALNTFGILKWLGWAMLVLGALLCLLALQRLRLARGGGGPGIVKITEGRIAYMGPQTGGVIDIDLLFELRITDRDAPTPFWILAPETGEPLSIPLTAEGADNLYDLFLTLPGLNPGRLSKAMTTATPGLQLIWQRRHSRVTAQISSDLLH